MDCNKHFDEVAPQWDKMQESFYSNAVRDKALYIADVQPDRLAADIGCGTGFLTAGLIQKGLKVIAVDRSQAMLTGMMQKFAGIDTIDYRLGEANNLPIADETINYAFANMYLHHLCAACKLAGGTAEMKEYGLVAIL